MLQWNYTRKSATLLLDSRIERKKKSVCLQYGRVPRLFLLFVGFLSVDKNYIPILLWITYYECTTKKLFIVVIELWNAQNRYAIRLKYIFMNRKCLNIYCFRECVDKEFMVVRKSIDTVTNWCVNQAYSVIEYNW